MFLKHLKDSDSDVKEDTRSSSEFLADLNAEFHVEALLANQKRGKYKALKAELALLTKKIDVISKNKSKKGLVVKSFDWDEESLSSKVEWVTNVKAFMTIAKDEPVMGKADVRKHVLDYTHVDLHYVEDQRKNLLNKFNSLKQELSSCKSELIDLKNTKTHNMSLQNEITILNLDNESLKDEVFDLKKVIEKWTSSKVTLDQLLTKQVPSNIVRALGGRGKRKEAISSKDIVFTKEKTSPYKTVLEITSDTNSECDYQEPLPLLPKLLEAEPISTSNDVIPLADLIQTATISNKTKKVTEKEPPIKTIKRKAQTNAPSILDPYPDKKAESSTKKILLTLMEEVKGLKEQIKPSSNNFASMSQTWSSKLIKGKENTRFGPCKHCGFKNHLSKDCYNQPKCSTCQSTDHLTKEHLNKLL
ncbi:hypothetical protein Tco_1090343 [Tanacetum coccineum]|uniref:CCHC-type domain-containing protein n=1 Tax=Tanacetum coccineum TaxID=301880 RepID=A0ABQ5I3Y6_9ASTR